MSPCSPFSDRVSWKLLPKASATLRPVAVSMIQAPDGVKTRKRDERMSFFARSTMKLFSFFLLLSVVPGTFVVSGVLQRQGSQAAHALSPLTVYVGSQDGNVYAFHVELSYRRSGSLLPAVA
jgi:hypothetical protein